MFLPFHLGVSAMSTRLDAQNTQAHTGAHRRGRGSGGLPRRRQEKEGDGLDARGVPSPSRRWRFTATPLHCIKRACTRTEEAQGHACFAHGVWKVGMRADVLCTDQRARAQVRVPHFGCTQFRCVCFERAGVHLLNWRHFA
jgi:hypothetical protein